MLTITGLRKTFGEVVAVDGLSLTARRGEVLGLLGPNGAGKSTTVALATGLLHPDAGSIVLEGAGPPTRPEARRLLGVAPQSLALYDELSGDENISFFGRLQGMSGARLRDRVASCMSLVGLTDRGRHRVATYSGGMKRRLNLAVALVHDPPLLLLDEPTVGVDPQSRHALLEAVKALRDQGRAVVYTTHYMEEAEGACDRVAIVDHGKLLDLDTVDGLIGRHGGPAELVLEGSGGPTRIPCADPVAKLQELARVGPVPPFRVERPSLESVFLGLTGRSLRD